MGAITYITPGFAVTPALGLEDFWRVSALGFRGVINNRPDGEEASQLDASLCAGEARRLGLTYRHIPASMLDLFTDPVVGAMADALQTERGQIGRAHV